MRPPNHPLAPGLYARPLAPDEWAPTGSPRSTLAPVELIQLYGGPGCPRSHGEFWDMASAADFVNLHFKVN